MPGRLTAFLATLLATLAVALAPFASAAAAAAAGARESEPSTGCCGEACTCGDACPCAAERDDGEPADEGAPAAPTERQDRRSLGCTPNAPDSIGLGCEPAHERTPLARDFSEPARPAGRALLSRISKWTT